MLSSLKNTLNYTIHLYLKEKCVRSCWYLRFSGPNSISSLYLIPPLSGKSHPAYQQSTPVREKGMSSPNCSTQIIAPSQTHLLYWNSCWEEVEWLALWHSQNNLKLKWKSHINIIFKQFQQRMYFLFQLKKLQLLTEKNADPVLRCKHKARFLYIHHCLAWLSY